MDCRIKGHQRAVGDVNAHMMMPFTLSAQMVSIGGDVEASMLPIATIYGAQRSAEHITATQHHVCTIGRDAMLLVSPDIMWLTEANDFTGVFEVVSNVEWNVE